MFYKSWYHLQLWRTTKQFSGRITSEVSELVAFVFSQMDKVLPNGLHDLYIVSDTDLEFCRNLLYVTPKSFDPRRVYVPKSYTEFGDTAEDFEKYKTMRDMATKLVEKREYQATLFHHKTYAIYEVIRTEIHRRQQARITPEMRALTRLRNETMLIRQLDTINRNYEAFNKQDDYGQRLNRSTDKEQREFTKIVTDMVKFIDEIDQDVHSEQLPANYKPHKPYAHIDVDLYNLDRKYQNAKNLLDSLDVYGMCAEYNLARYEERNYREGINNASCPYSKDQLTKEVARWKGKLDAAKKRKLPAYSDVKRAKWEVISLPIEEFDRLYPISDFDRRLLRTRWEVAEELKHNREKRAKEAAKASAYPFEIDYNMRDRQHSYEFTLNRRKEALQKLQEEVKATLGLDVSLASLYSPVWKYAPPQMYMVNYWPPDARYIMVHILGLEWVDHPKN